MIENLLVTVAFLQLPPDDLINTDISDSFRALNI